MLTTLPTSQTRTRTPALKVARPESNPIEEKVRDDVRLQSHPGEDGLRVRPNAESFFMGQEDGEAKGTVVLYHGFTAAPWQYREMAEKLHGEGFNVYAPRMPGHGLADETGRPSHKQMPKTSQQKTWSDFAQSTYNDAKSLGAPVHVVGLSGGANVALKVAEENSEVGSVTTMAPFLGAGASGVFFPVLNIVDMVTFGLFGKLLDRIPRKQKPHDDQTPKTEGSWGNALAMYRVGARVDKVDAPWQVITTAGDPLSGTKQVGQLFKKSEPTAEDGWYHFSEQDNVKHAMLSPLENKNAEAVAKIQSIVSDIVTGQSTTNFPTGQSSASAPATLFAQEPKLQAT